MATYVSNRDGGSTDEQGHYRFQVKVWDGNIENGMVVTQNSPLGMSVLVGTGDLKIDYSNYAYTAWNDANSSVTITTADGSNPRIDRIVAYIDRGMTPSVSPPNNQGMLKFMAVAGTPNAVPTRPSDATVNSAVGASNPWCNLADVRVNAGVTTITNANITDTRVLVSATANSVITASLANSSVTATKVDFTTFQQSVRKVGTDGTTSGTTELVLTSQSYNFINGSKYLIIASSFFSSPNDSGSYYDHKIRVNGVQVVAGRKGGASYLQDPNTIQDIYTASATATYTVQQSYTRISGSGTISAQTPVLLIIPLAN